MNKKGFTLAELLAVIAIIGFITLLIIPRVFELIDKSKNKAYGREVSIIENAAKQYFLKRSYDIEFDASGIAEVPLSEIVNAGLLRDPVINPLTGVSFQDTANVKIIKDGNKVDYVFDDLKYSNEACFVFDAPTKTITDFDFSNTSCGPGINIPSRIGGVNVEHIGDGAFINPTAQSCRNAVGAYISVALNYNHFTGDGYDYCYYSAYSSAGTYSITALTLPYTLKTIGHDAFKHHGITRLVIPNNVETIEPIAFSDNDISVLTIGRGVKRIELAAFEQNDLSSVNIPGNVDYIGESAFYLNNMTSLTLNSGTEYIGKNAFYSNQLTSLIIPATVTQIDNWAFSTNLLSLVSFNTGLVTIGQYAFATNAITSVLLPSTVTTVGDYAFYTNVINFVNLGSVQTLGTGAFRANLITWLTIPSTLTTITAQAFYSNRIATVTLPATVTSVGDYAFRSNLITTVSLGSVQTLGVGAFYINSIANVTIPVSVNSMGMYAFRNNVLTSIVMSKVGVTIGDDFLYGANNNFRTSYTAGGIGTYNGTQSGTWTKA